MIVTIDMGATRSRFGVAEDFSEKPIAVLPTPKTVQDIIGLVCNVIGKFENVRNTKLGGIAIGCPGLVDFDGYIHSAIHSPLEKVNLQSSLEECFRVPIFVTNDVKAQAMGYIENTESFAFLSFGTGVGGAFVDKGKLIHGQNNFAGEIGHVPLFSKSIQCRCGKYGCLDAYASGYSLIKSLGKDWWDRELSLDEQVVLYDVSDKISIVINLIQNLLDPKTIVLAGTLMKNPLVLKAIQNSIVEGENLNKPTIKIVPETWKYANLGLKRFFTQCK